MGQDVPTILSRQPALHMSMRTVEVRSVVVVTIAGQWLGCANMTETPVSLFATLGSIVVAVYALVAPASS